MRLSSLFGKTLRQAPAEAETPSHRLILRARLAEQIAAGIYAFLPLGWAVLRRVEQIVREEMDREGGQEVRLPILTPVEQWESTGRRTVMDDILLVTEDRRGRELVLGPTHEETFTELVRRQLQSYRALPLRLYQIEAKFRDEPRPRGGLIRLRQFTMKDLYSFDADQAGLTESYAAMDRAYRRIFARCQVPVVAVQAHSGSMGGSESQEFMLLTDIGEDTVVTCPACGYAANAERAEIRRSQPDRPNEPLPIEEVSTPGARTIEEVARFLGIGRDETLKAVFYVADGEPVFVAIRGDLDVNEVKLAAVLGARELRLMSDDEVRAAGLTAGAASPIGVHGMRVIADESAAW
ncbi:MAG TPA: proline--tRNA ligase, partial [Dehalococcoidia bacterium]|nr:proline--tRNA ligase [Dehalococcoidia bacterium]